MKFLGVLCTDRLLDVLHLLVAFLLAVLLHLKALLFSQSSCPDFDVVNLFIFVYLKCFLFSTQYILVESHDSVIVEVFFTSFKINNSVFANFFFATLGQFVKNFSAPELHFLVELIH